MKSCSLKINLSPTQTKTQLQLRATVIRNTALSVLLRLPWQWSMLHVNAGQVAS